MQLQRNKVTNCVIAAGGKGTRLTKVNNGQPKALTKVNGREIIFDQIDKFLSYGCRRFDILLGYKSHKIQSAIEFEFKKSDAKFNYHFETEPLGSGGALLYHSDQLPNEFLFTYCDIYFDLDLNRLVSHHFENLAGITLVCHPNDHPQDSDLVELNQQNQVVALKAHPHRKNDFPGNLVNAAFYVISREILKTISYQGYEDFAQEVIARISKTTKISAYVTHELLKDMGTPERLAKLEITLKRSGNKKAEKVIFLDRDGTLNQITQGEYIKHEDQLKLIPGVAPALVELRQMGFFLILISNQPVLARGDISPKQLSKIHARLDWLLADQGAYLDYKFICPHHPDGGFDGEVHSLKINCACRKPETGLFEKAANIMSIDINASWMVGDTWRDVQSGNRFGLNTCLISNLASNDANLTSSSLIDFVKFLKNNL